MRSSAMLRWRTATEKAHRSRNPVLRNARALYDNLAARIPVTPFAKAAHVILVDDVTTTGAHFQAAEARLRERGLKVTGAICVARAVQEQPERAFRRIRFSVPRFDPDDSTA